MNRAKKVFVWIIVVVFVSGGFAFFSAWKLAKDMSQPIEWCTVESINDDGSVTFTDEPGRIEQKDYTVWDIFGAYYRHIVSSRSLGELFGPVLIDESTRVYEY